MAWQSSTINPATTTPAADISKITNDLSVLKGVIGGTPDAAVPSVWQTPAGDQTQTGTAFTSTGTAPNYVLTPSPAIASYISGQRFRVSAHAAGTTGSNTINVNGLGSKNLKQYDAAGVKSSAVITSGQLFDAEYDGTDFVVLTPLPPVNSAVQLQTIDYTLSGNALTLKLNPVTLAFRSTTLTSGTPSSVSIGSQITTTISSGSTGGTTSAIPSEIIFAAINNAGTAELAWGVNLGSLNVDESTLISTTAEGGAGAADSANTWYSTTARSSVAFRIVGIFRSTQTTAGTWAQSPSLVQPIGGLVQSGRMMYMQFPSIATTSGTTADQTGIPSWAKRITVFLRATSTNGTSAKQLQVGAGSVVTSGYTSSASGSYSGNVISGLTSTTGFVLAISSVAANTEYTEITLINLGNNVWQYMSRTSMTTSNAASFIGGGEISLSGTLDRIRLTMVNGTDTFDAGSFSVLVEG